MSSARCLRHSSSGGAAAPSTVRRAGPSTRTERWGESAIAPRLSDTVRLPASTATFSCRMPPPLPHPALEDVQRAVGERYEVVSLAGAGGMGAVFRTRHRTLGHIVAVKVLPPEVAASAMRRERFRREATLGAGLEHPNIVRVYEFDTRDAITSLIMTFVRRATLEERLRDSDRPATDAVLRTVREIADALGYVHRRGIVHRDVKPANILIDEDSGRALLADFGVAHVEGTADTSLTQPGVTIGTPGYMAPEQIAGGRVDGRADWYSLAAVAFEALTGRATDFRADRATLARALRAARPDLSAREAATLVAPLAERPDERPTSGEAWITALERTRPRRRRWAIAALAVIVAAGVARLVWGPAPASDVPPRLAVMPFAVLGTPPYPATQLPEYFVSRFRPVERVIDVLSFGRVVAQTGTAPLSNEDARDLARRLGARFFVQGSVSYTGPTVTLTATLYEGSHARRSGTATGRVGLDESDMMDRVWTQLYPEFTPSADVTLPNSGPDALAAYLNADAAFRRGDYRTARDGYTRVIRADTGFAIARLRLALIAAQVDPTEQGFGPPLRRAMLHQRFLALKSLAFQAAAFGTPAQREGPARSVLRCLEQRAATDQERVRVLRMGLAADLAAGWVDSARARLGRAGPWAERERDLWVLVMHDVGLPALGDWQRAAARLTALPRVVQDTDVTIHWALARAGVDRARHAAVLARLAAGEAPLPASLAADLQAQAALARGDSSAALRLWSGATRRYAVLSVPFELVASLWPLRLDLVRVAVARRRSSVVDRACASFEGLMGYTDQVAQPEVARLCFTPGLRPGSGRLVHPGEEGGDEDGRNAARGGEGDPRHPAELHAERHAHA